MARRPASAGYRDTACAAQAYGRRGTSPTGRTAAGEVVGLDDRRVSLLRDRSGTSRIDRARRPARGRAHRQRRRRTRRRRHQPLRLRPARARARRRARGRCLVARGAGRRDLHRGRQARRGSAGHPPPGRAAAARHPLQRARLHPPAQAAVRAGRARAVPAPAADIRRRAGRRAAAGRPVRRHGARGARPAARRGARRPPGHAPVPAAPTSRRRSTTSRPSSAATCSWPSRARPGA